MIKKLSVMFVLLLIMCGCSNNAGQSMAEQMTVEQVTAEPLMESQVETTEEYVAIGLKEIFHEIMPGGCEHSQEPNDYTGILCGDVEIARRFIVSDYEGSMDAKGFFEFWQKDWNVLEVAELESRDPYMHLYQCELEGQGTSYVAFCEEYDGMPMRTVVYQVMEDGYMAQMESIVKSLWLEREWQEIKEY